MAVAYEILGQDVPLKAAADLSAKQFYILRISADDTVNTGNTTSYPIGVQQNDPAAAGREVNVRISGFTKCIAGEEITAGNPIAPDTDGKGVVATSDSYMIGIAVIGASAEDEIFTLRLGTGAAAA